MTDSDPAKSAKAQQQTRSYLGLRLTYDIYQRMTHQEQRTKLEVSNFSLRVELGMHQLPYFSVHYFRDTSVILISIKSK